MNVLLWGDNRNDKKSFFPSLPLMKISAWHKKHGDKVKLYDESDADCDILYKSKTFSFTKDLIFTPKTGIVVSGGSGYATHVENGKEAYNNILDESLPDYIEFQMPDYSLYPKATGTAYGFLTRGCPCNCAFCIVSKKEGRCSKKVADLNDIWRGQKRIKLLDANILACKERENLLLQLAKSHAIVDYTQGVDARLIDEDVSKLLAKIKTEMIHFAFDSIKDEQSILNGLSCFKKHSKLSVGETRVYVLVNFDTNREQDVYRVRKICELGYQPYIMIYRKGTHDDFLTKLRTWANSTVYFFACDFFDFKYGTKTRKMGDLYGAIARIKS